MARIDASQLADLDPVSSLSPGRREELADLCSTEKVSQGLDPFRMNLLKSEQALYLLKGELKLEFGDGSATTLQAGSAAARQPVAGNGAGVAQAVALTDIDIVRIDADLLDIMLTWDQLAGYETSTRRDADAAAPDTGGWMNETGVFSAEALKTGLFSRLPPANIEEMFRRMSRIEVDAGQVIIQQGAEGDYYYLIESGVAAVTRTTGEFGASKLLAELQEGSAFGEEALVSDNKRNATVTMKTKGVLLRLGKSDFIELLKKPLLSQITPEEAQRKMQAGAQLLDVRTPGEFNFKHMWGAINIPLQDIRDAMRTMDRGKEYITACCTSRRAAAAAFILAQNGFRVCVTGLSSAVLPFGAA